MEQLLWTFEDIKRFTTHPDAPVRLWAVERLIKCFPQQAGDVLITRVDDQGNFIATQILDFLAETGQTEKYGPVLLDYLQRAPENQRGRIAQTLAKLNYQPALPAVLEQVNQIDPSTTFVDFVSFVKALGQFGGDQARQTLWSLLEQGPALSNKLDLKAYQHTFLFGRDITPHRVLTPVIEALLTAAQPEDIPRLVEYYRTLPLDKDSLGSFGHDRHPLSAFAAAVQCERLLEEMWLEVDKGIWAMFEQAEWWLTADVYLSDDCFDDLEDAFDRLYSGVFEILLPEAHRLVAERGDNLPGWQAAWEAGKRPVGYRHRTLYTMLILQALANQPKAVLTPRKQESVLGLALLAQLSIDKDDQARLESAPDKTEILLSILADPREHVLPDIVDHIVALGPKIAPRVVNLFDPVDYSWGALRVAKTIEHLAREYPGSCNAAVPKLIAAIHEEQGDFMNEAASAALEAIGPAAVPIINQHLRRTKNGTREIYLSGTLGEIPVESATEVILEKLLSGQPIDEGEVMTLVEIGSASAIEPLYRLWQPGDPILAESLLILCQLNGVEKPEIPGWRRVIQAENERIEQLTSGDSDDSPTTTDTPDQDDRRPTLIREWQLESEDLQALGLAGKHPKKKSFAQKHTHKKKKRRK